MYTYTYDIYICVCVCTRIYFKKIEPPKPKVVGRARNRRENRRCRKRSTSLHVHVTCLRVNHQEGIYHCHQELYHEMLVSGVCVCVCLDVQTWRPHEINPKNVQHQYILHYIHGFWSPCWRQLKKMIQSDQLIEGKRDTATWEVAKTCKNHALRYCLL